MSKRNQYSICNKEPHFINLLSAKGKNLPKHCQIFGSIKIQKYRVTGLSGNTGQAISGLFLGFRRKQQ